MAALVDPGDEVILHEPSYVAYLPSIIFNGGVPVLVPTTRRDGFELDPAASSGGHAAHQGALPGLPVQPDRRRPRRGHAAALADIAVRHDLLVVSDEIYDRLVYGGHRHLPISSLPGMRERTVTLGGFSKAYAMTGWRVGYACAPRTCSKASSRSTSTRSCRRPRSPRTRRVVALIGAEQDVQRMVEEYDRRGGCSSPASTTSGCPRSSRRARSTPSPASDRPA
jgi:aminotransferase